MKTLYLICGISFAGKSTLAREMQKQTGIQLVDHDEIYGRKLIKSKKKLSGKQRTEMWQSVRPEVKTAVDHELAAGNSVILDSTNTLRSEREKYSRLAKKHDAKCTVIFIDTPKEQARSRILENRASKKRQDVPDYAFYKSIENLQKPDQKENVLVYSGSISEKLWVGQNFTRH